MFFECLSNIVERPSTPVPSFILTDSATTTSSSSSSSSSATSTVISSSPISRSSTLQILTQTLDQRLAHLKATLGEHHPDVAQVYTSLGDACMHNEDYDAAMEYYTQALQIVKTTMSAAGHPTHPQVADILCSMANVSMKRGMFQESKATYRAALDIYQKAFTDRKWVNNPNVDGPSQKVDYELQSCKASTLASMGSVEFQQRNYAAALVLFQDALLDSKRAAVSGVALERMLTTSSTTAAVSSSSSSSSSTMSRGKKKKGERGSVLKEARLLVADIYSHIASTYAEQGKRPLAIENYNQALSLHMQELGEDHETVACTLHNIGTMHYRSGEYQLALKSYRQVLKMRRLLFENDHVCVAECLINIATVHEKAEEMDKAVSAFNAAMRIMTKHYGSSSIQCADLNMQLGSLYARSGCQDLAMEYYELAHGTYKQHLGLGESHPRIKAVTDAMHYVKQKENNNSSNSNKDDDDDESSSIFLSATETWSNFLSQSCGGGSFCIPSSAGPGITAGGPAAVAV